MVPVASDELVVQALAGQVTCQHRTFGHCLVCDGPVTPRAATGKASLDVGATLEVDGVRTRVLVREVPVRWELDLNAMARIRP